MNEGPRNRPFEAALELKNVLSESGDSRREALAGWKEAYIMQRHALARVQAEVIRRLRENPGTTKEELVAFFEDESERGGFSSEQREVGLAALDILEQRHNIIRTVREKYPNDSELFTAVFDVSPIGKVRTEEGPASISFICSNGLDLARVLNFNKKGLIAFYAIVRDFTLHDDKGAAMFVTPRLPELKDMIVVGRGSMVDERMGNIRVHEEQHMLRHVLLAAAERVQTVSPEAGLEQEPWQQLLRECTDSIESAFEDELLAMNKGEAQNPSRMLSQDHYFKAFIQEQIDALREHLAVSEANQEETGKALDPDDVENVIDALESNEFKESLWERVMKGNSAYARLRNIGRFSHEEITAFLDLEPLGQWPKLEKRLLAESSRGQS